MKWCHKIVRNTLKFRYKFNSLKYCYQPCFNMRPSEFAYIRLYRVSQINWPVFGALLQEALWKFCFHLKRTIKNILWPFCSCKGLMHNWKLHIPSDPSARHTFSKCEKWIFTHFNDESLDYVPRVLESKMWPTLSGFVSSVHDFECVNYQHSLDNGILGIRFDSDRSIFDYISVVHEKRSFRHEPVTVQK